MSSAAASRAVAARAAARPAPGWWPVAAWIAVPFIAAAVTHDHYMRATLAAAGVPVVPYAVVDPALPRPAQIGRAHV